MTPTTNRFAKVSSNSLALTNFLLDPFTFEMEFDDLPKETLKKLIFDETEKFQINRMGPSARIEDWFKIPRDSLHFSWSPFSLTIQVAYI